MNLTAETHGPVTVITLPGRLLQENAAEARNEVTELIKTGHRKLVMDLQPVEMIDSSGLSVLVSALKSAQIDAGEVVLLGPNDNVRSLIELTRLHQVFEIYLDRDAAIQRLS